MVADDVVDAVVGKHRVDHLLCWLVEAIGLMIVPAVLGIIDLVGEDVFVARSALPFFLGIVPPVGHATVQRAVGSVVVNMLQVGSECHVVLTVESLLVDIHRGDVVAVPFGIETEVTVGLVRNCLRVNMIHGLGGEDLCLGAHGCHTHQDCKK